MPDREHFLVRQGQRLISIGIDEVTCFWETKTALRF
ncbi:hypothetical protein BN8_02806 [Fibrisoma limi BUZ 3]|uniref:Uncharacterized protein n=1 Tax=Fibrisoma limi BUZ 3 TaxID=1185876 RepID=I2GIG7_9BACT|nr:hypothetical protein BN8_02806 [Fibrisoma limi BUZ 3]